VALNPPAKMVACHISSTLGSLMVDAVILETRQLVKEFKGFIAVNQVDSDLTAQAKPRFSTC
jgi:hypothetical protein